MPCERSRSVVYSQVWPGVRRAGLPRQSPALTPDRGGAALDREVLDRYSAMPVLRNRSCPLDVAAVGYVYHGHHMGLVVDSVDDPVGAPARAEPVVHRRKQPLPDPVGVFQ